MGGLGSEEEKRDQKRRRMKTQSLQYYESCVVGTGNKKGVYHRQAPPNKGSALSTQKKGRLLKRQTECSQGFLDATCFHLLQLDNSLTLVTM
jgi:hypothetical protein